jgi:hypothetical protein
VPVAPDVVEDLVGWRIALQFLPPTEAPFDVSVRDAWDRPSAAGEGDRTTLKVEVDADDAEARSAEELVDALVELSWAAVGGRQRMAAVVVEVAAGSWELRAQWPPNRVQERRYHRAGVRLDAWVTKFEPDVVTAMTRTVDLSAGGMAVERLPSLALDAEQPVSVCALLEDAPLMATALVIDPGASDRPTRLGFELISTADQDRLMGFVHQTEHGRLA